MWRQIISDPPPPSSHIVTNVWPPSPLSVWRHLWTAPYLTPYNTTAITYCPSNNLFINIWLASMLPFLKKTLLVYTPNYLYLKLSLILQIIMHGLIISLILLIFHSSTDDIQLYLHCLAIDQSTVALIDWLNALKEWKDGWNQIGWNWIPTRLNSCGLDPWQTAAGEDRHVQGPWQSEN